MTLIFWLFVAHFLADFPLQTNAVYRLKCKDFKGGIVHGGIVFLTLMVILSPFLHHVEAWFALVTIAGGHFIQDTTQEPWNSRIDRSFVGYLLDQTGHLWWTFLVWLVYLVPIQSDSLVSNSWYLEPSLPLYILGLVLTTYVAETTKYLLNSKSTPVFIRNYKQMLYRGLIFTALFLTLFLI